MDSIYLLLTPNCNLSCTYCFQTDSNTEFPGKQFHAQPREKASIVMLKRFAEFCGENNISQVEFFGGEPFLYRDLFMAAVEIIAATPGIRIGVVTNGTMIDEDVMRLIEEHNISILLSLDGHEERHNQMRGSFQRIKPWFQRLTRLPNVTVALQAGVISGLSHNVQYVWQQGFENVYVNIIESYGWYEYHDTERFKAEYKSLLLAMLRGDGILSCAIQISQHLQDTVYRQGCGIAREGLACDWRGRLFPCHRAVELGAQFSIGDIYTGIDSSLEKNIRNHIGRETFQSTSAGQYSLTSFCPVGIYKQHGDFSAAWSQSFCEMIEIKAKLVAKYFHAIQELKERWTQQRPALV